MYPITELLEHMKRPVVKIQNYRISMKQGNSRMSERSPSEIPVLAEWQKPEATYKTNASWQ